MAVTSSPAPSAHGPSPAGPALRVDPSPADPSPAGPALRVDPTLAEAAVFRALSRRDPLGSGALAADRRRAEPLYAIADAGEREAAFGRLAVAEFAALGLAAPILRAAAEWPNVAVGVRVVLLGEARGRSDEGVTCEPGGAHIGIRVETSRLDDPAGLLAWARHALGHAHDTLDPSFGFEPGWDDARAARVAGAAQARLHRLWDVSVDGRLAAKGRVAAEPTRRRHRAALAADLPGSDAGEVDAIMDRLWDGPRPTFADLLSWAVRPLAAVGTTHPETASAPRRDYCPLCGFPSHDIRPPEPAVADAVAADYPAWQSAHGLCGRCTDRYRFAGRLGGRP